MNPLLTLPVLETLRAAADSGHCAVAASLDLQRSTVQVAVHASGFCHAGGTYPFPARLRERTIYHWHDGEFAPVQRFTGGLLKLVPTHWGPPTFEIDGIKMLPTAQVSPYADAQAKVALIQPRGKVVLDTCGGLGYFAAWCVQGGARQVVSFEKNPDVLWLRELNPWSPPAHPPLMLTLGDIAIRIATLEDGSVDAILHDPPRFGIAGELYSQRFYEHLARVLRPRGILFHYTGSPNRLTSNRDVPAEVTRRLQAAGFTVRAIGDSLLARLR